MLFNSITFAVFLPLVFVIYWCLPHKYRWVLLLGASYYFYMSWNVKYIFLILFTTAISYGAGLLLGKENREKWRKIIVALTLIICFGVLFCFKYFNFFSNSIVTVFEQFAITLHPVTLNVLLPVGISFYTFQTLSYVIDVYRGTVKPERHFGIYATFISFFPQLVAGPIERTENLLPQIRSEKIFNYKKATYGLKLMAWGFFKKLAIADVIAVYVDTVYETLPTATGGDLLLAVFFFTIQIYCDFSGYSDIAIGTSKLMGIDLMVNFKSPYFATSVKEFWSRWHISLSTWFKDYLYIPLGGNRCSKIRHYFNLVITFLCSGLWHGANWTFIVWGGMHGLIQVLENIVKKGNYKKVSSAWKKVLSGMVVFAFCNLAWVFFRAETVADACYVIKNIFVGMTDPSTYFVNTIGLLKGELLVILLSIGLLGVYDYFSLKTDVIQWISKRNIVIRWCVYIVLIWIIIFRVPVTSGSEFIYFQF